MYRLLFSVVFGRLPPETSHRLGFWLIRTAAATPGLRWLLRRPFDPVLRVRVFGLDLPGPFGLAAGFDKDALGPDALSVLGFGFVEVGTVTAEPQPGNPRPRLFRLPADRALINRMGFNNSGAAAVAARLSARPVRVALGVNIGKTRLAQDALADYVASARLLAGLASYLVINVSSPNTPGLRNLQAVAQLRPLVQAVREGTHVPLLVKIAPDLGDADLDAIADLALEVGLDGIIAANTSVAREHLISDPAGIGEGGLSGPPLRQRVLYLLRRLRARVGDRVVLVACGGIETADDAWECILAGATLVQGYTGFVYGGPLWPHRIHAGLARKAREAGLTSIQQAVGTEAVHGDHRQ